MARKLSPTGGNMIESNSKAARVLGSTRNMPQPLRMVRGSVIVVKVVDLRVSQRSLCTALFSYGSYG